MTGMRSIAHFSIDLTTAGLKPRHQLSITCRLICRRRCTQARPRSAAAVALPAPAGEPVNGLPRTQARAPALTAGARSRVKMNTRKPSRRGTTSYTFASPSRCGRARRVSRCRIPVRRSRAWSSSKRGYQQRRPRPRLRAPAPASGLGSTLGGSHGDPRVRRQSYQAGQTRLTTGPRQEPWPRPIDWRRGAARVQLRRRAPASRERDI
jgi:hypothetical protein